MLDVIITNAEAKDSMELAEIIELNKYELINHINYFQCPEEFMDTVEIDLILKHICKITNLDFEKLKEKLYTEMTSADFIKAFETSIDNIFKYYWFGIKYEVADKKFDLVFSMGDFFNVINHHYAKTTKIDEDFYENEIITEDEYNALTAKSYEEDGCKYYHEEIFNNDLVNENEDLIKNFSDSDVYGQMFLYKEVKTYNRDFLTDVNTIFHSIGHYIDLTQLGTIPFEDMQ